jgi:hypothetical protein
MIRAAILEHSLARQDLTRARTDDFTAVAEHDRARYALPRANGARADAGPEPK